MTDKDKPQADSDPRYAIWAWATAGLFCFSVVVGFIWLPSAQPGADSLGWWGDMCRAIGLTGSREQLPENLTDIPPTSIAWTPETRKLLGKGNAVRGAALAASCVPCHGDNGISSDAIFPNLAGQSVAALYKQLADFKSGKRNNEVMGAYLAQLSDQDMLDVATSFAAMPSPFTGSPDRADSEAAAAQRLVEVGNPMRGIAPCAACHGPVGFTMGAPGLQGQQHAYLVQQMQAFAAGSRRNDIDAQMRSVAYQLSDAEILLLADYYASVGNIPAVVRP